MKKQKPPLALPDIDSPEFKAQTQRGKAVMKGALKLLAADPDSIVVVNGWEWHVSFCDGLYYREGVWPRTFFDLGEALVASFKKEEK